MHLRLSSQAVASTTVLALVSALAVLGSCPSAASAQGWLADRSRTEGPGIRLGDFEFHPGVGVELGYDSNVYFAPDNPPPGVPGRFDSAILRVTPHLLFSTIGQQRENEGEAAASRQPPTLAFRGGLWGSYYEFFADERRRNFSIDAGARLQILPERPFSISISDNFSRSIRPFAQNFFETSTARLQNTAAVDFTFASDGQVLQIRTG